MTRPSECAGNVKPAAVIWKCNHKTQNTKKDAPCFIVPSCSLWLHLRFARGLNATILIPRRSPGSTTSSSIRPWAFECSPDVLCLAPGDAASWDRRAGKARCSIFSVLSRRAGHHLDGTNRSCSPRELAAFRNARRFRISGSPAAAMLSPRKRIDSDAGGGSSDRPTERARELTGGPQRPHRSSARQLSGGERQRVRLPVR